MFLNGNNPTRRTKWSISRPSSPPSRSAPSALTCRRTSRSSTCSLSITSPWWCRTRAPRGRRSTRRRRRNASLAPAASKAARRSTVALHSGIRACPARSSCRRGRTTSAPLFLDLVRPIGLFRLLRSRRNRTLSRLVTKRNTRRPISSAHRRSIPQSSRVSRLGRPSHPQKRPSCLTSGQ